MRGSVFAAIAVFVVCWPVGGQTVAQPVAPPAVVKEARYGLHGYQAWAPGLMALWGEPKALGLWLDKERYDTLDATAGAFIHLESGAAEPAHRVEVSIRMAADDGTAGVAVRQTTLDAHRGDIALDLDIRGLAPGHYLLTAEVVREGKAVWQRSRPFRIEAATPPAPRGRVRLAVRNPAGTRPSRQPAYAVVALPKGALHDTDHAQLVTESGQEIPAQFKAQNRWDALGSIRWLGVWFTMDHAAGAAETALYVEYGPDVRAAASRVGALQVVEADGGWTVANGPLRVRLSGATGNALESVEYDADGDGTFAKEELAYEASQAGPYLVTDGGDRYEARADAQPLVKVEENGPECFILRSEGWYVGEKKPGYADDSGLCRQVTRVRIQRGVPRIDLSHNWTMTARSAEARFSDIGIKGRVPGAQRAAFGLDAGFWADSVAPKSKLHLVQDRWNNFDVWLQSHQPRHHIPRLAGAPKLSPVAGGNHAPGWAALANARVGLAVGCEDFWQNYPKELSVDGEHLTFHVWPAHGRDNLREVTDETLNALYWLHESRFLNFALPPEVVNYPHREWHTAKYFLHFGGESDAIGLSKTHEIRLCFFPGGAAFESVDRDMRAALQPTLASPDPVAVTASGAFGPVGPRDPARFPLLESQIETMFKNEVRLQELAADYGMFIYGDGHSGFDLETRSFSVYRAWRLTHHNVCFTPWLLYARSGDPFYFLCGLRNARYIMDVAFCHRSRPDLEALPYGPGKRKGALNDYKGLVPWHSGNRNPDYNSMTDFMLYLTYFTGNDQGRDIAAEWWACTQRVTGPPGSSRTCSGTLYALLDLYQDTWDRRMLPMIEGCYLQQIKGQNAEWGYFNEWQNYAPWLDKYWLFTGSEHARGVLVRWADACLRGWGDISARWGTPLNVPTMAYYATGDPKYLRYVSGLLWEESRSGYHEPGSPLDQLYRGGAVSLAHYYMQRAVYAMEALRRAPSDPGVGESRWVLHPALGADGKPLDFVEFWVLDEDDSPIEMLFFGVFRGPMLRVTVTAPDGKAVFEEELKTNILVAHDSHQSMPQAVRTLPPDGVKGVYRVRVQEPSRQGFNFFVPLTQRNKEVYACATPGEVSLRSGRACFEVPKDSGTYTVSLRGQKGGPYPSSLYDDRGNELAKGSFESRPEGEVLRGYPVTVDSATCQRYMAFSNCATATAFTVQGKHPPRFIAVSFERLFDPEQAARR